MFNHVISFPCLQESRGRSPTIHQTANSPSKGSDEDQPLQRDKSKRPVKNIISPKALATAVKLGEAAVQEAKAKAEAKSKTPSKNPFKAAAQAAAKSAAKTAGKTPRQKKDSDSDFEGDDETDDEDEDEEEEDVVVEKGPKGRHLEKAAHGKKYEVR